MSKKSRLDETLIFLTSMTIKEMEQLMLWSCSIDGNITEYGILIEEEISRGDAAKVVYKNMRETPANLDNNFATFELAVRYVAMKFLKDRIENN